MLTPRERETLSLITQGRSNAAIAREPVITLGAVEKHVTNIFGKLNLPATDDDHRRVLAVLAYLGAGGAACSGGLRRNIWPDKLGFVSLEEHSIETAGERCEECGARLTPAELQVVLESGGPTLCAVHAAEDEPGLAADEDFAAE